MKPVEEVAYSSYHVYDARRLETRVKERTSYLLPTIVGKLDGTPPSSRAIPMKNSSLRNYLHSCSSRTPDLCFQKNESPTIDPTTVDLLAWDTVTFNDKKKLEDENGSRQGEEAMTSRLRKERRLGWEERETSINKTGRTSV